MTRIDVIIYLENRKTELKKRLEQVPTVGHHFDTKIITTRYDEVNKFLEFMKGEVK